MAQSLLITSVAYRATVVSDGCRHNGIAGAEALAAYRTRLGG